MKAAAKAQTTVWAFVVSGFVASAYQLEAAVLRAASLYFQRRQSALNQPAALAQRPVGSIVR